jgi:outer membrane protein assembly factor BamD
MPLRTTFCICLLLLLSGCTTKLPSSNSLSKYFTEGEELYKKKNYEESIEKWKKLKENSLGSPQLSAIADMKIADAQFESGNYIEAAATYESFAKFHPKNDKAPYAYFRVALCHYMQIGTIDRDQTPVKNAVSHLENFIRDYPASEYVPEAREKLESCYIKQAEHEIYIGRFYYRFGKYQSAIKRLEECVARYPKLPVTDEAYLYLEKAYFKTGEKERGKEAFNRLFIKFPTSKYIKEADSLMKSYQ